MSDIDSKSIFPRFEAPEQVRLRETLLRELQQWYLQAVLDDRAETALPPLELIEVSGHG